MKAQKSMKCLEDLRQVQQEILDQSNGSGTGKSPTCREWKSVYDKLIAIKLKLQGKPEMGLIGPITLQWTNVTMRLLQQHLQDELVPFLGLLTSDLTNMVDLHEVPSSWSAHVLKDVMVTLRSQAVRKSSDNDQCESGALSSLSLFETFGLLV